MKLTEHFTKEEFDCKCGCGTNNISTELVNVLEIIRNGYGPLVITSGCRCEAHNAREGGKKNSAHLRGYAVDIQCIVGNDRYRLIRAALGVGITRIGVAKTFIHLDVDPTLPASQVWLYS